MILPLLAAALCNFDYTVWNVREKRSVDRVSVSKPYEEAPKGALGCTPCREDQVDVTLSNGIHFRACRGAAEKLKGALEAAIEKGQKIVSVVGYRAQMSRGDVDAKGNRTELSNHSFGIAVDVNENQNGLYDNCPKWSPKCRLRKGGKYVPGSELSLVSTSPLVVAMKEAGFSWGGEIEGRQKDFMHFSPTGY